MNQVKLHNKLKVLRAERNLTQQELAIMVGVTRKTINVIEAGNYAPSIVLALSLAKALGTSVEELFHI